MFRRNQPGARRRCLASRPWEGSAVSAKEDDQPDYARLALLDLATGKTSVLTDGWEQSIGRPAWSADGKTLVVEAESRARTNLYAVSAAGGPPRLIWQGGRASGVDAKATGQVVFTCTTLADPLQMGPEAPELEALVRRGARLARVLVEMSLGRS